MPVLVVIDGGVGECWWSQPITRVTGTGFSGVENCQPVPVPVTTRHVNPYGFVNP